MAFTKLVFSAFFLATVASARVLRSMPDEATKVEFVNNCGYTVTVTTVSDTCEKATFDVVDSLLVEDWTTSGNSLFDFCDSAYDSAGNAVQMADSCGLTQLMKMPDDSIVYLCAPRASPAPAPSPTISSTAIIKNSCTVPVMIGNLFKANDPTADYDIRCAPYVTMDVGESMYLDIPDPKFEIGYFSAFDASDPQGVPIVYPNHGGAGVHAAELTFPDKEHPGCDNIIKGNDFWYSYYLANKNDVITLCG